MIELSKLNQTELAKWMADLTPETRQELLTQAALLRDRHYGKTVYTRGLIEFTNYCKNNCYYCGIRRANSRVERYRLTTEEILECCEIGHGLGYRTFVLQGGEDEAFTDELMVSIIRAIRQQFPDCAITLSLGERSYDAYFEFFQAGANRYLLRHETANENHYKRLHPPSMSLANRKACLLQLKEIGYQVGAGFMVGSPFQTLEHLAEDLIFLKELEPAMVGIGPFIPQQDTPFKDQPAGSVELTITLIAMLRLLLPKALIPATTAVGTLDPRGREKVLQAGANVVMPNLSPLAVRNKYLLYDNKICTGDEAAECRMCIEGRIRATGLELSQSRGDHVDWRKEYVY